MVSQQIKIPNWFVIPAKAGTYYLKYLQVPGFQLMGNDNILRISNLARNILNILLCLNVQY